MLILNYSLIYIGRIVLVKTWITNYEIAPLGLVVIGYYTSVLNVIKVLLIIPSIFTGKVFWKYQILYGNGVFPPSPENDWRLPKNESK